MPIPLLFQGKFTEKYFKKFHFPKTQFQLLDGWFLPLLLGRGELAPLLNIPGVQVKQKAPYFVLEKFTLLTSPS